MSSIPRSQLSRRDWFRCAALGVGAVSSSGWLSALAAKAASDPRRQRSCILLWMPGGPSQIDTFDPKPDHPNGGPFKPQETAIPGVRIAEHLPKLARQMKHVAILRSMSTREGDHARATFHLKTGYPPRGPVQYPNLGSLLSKELGVAGAEIPNFVSIAPNRALNPAGGIGPGFLGPAHAPLEVGDGRSPDLQVSNLDMPNILSGARRDARQRLWLAAEQEFNASRPGPLTHSHAEAYQAALRLMQSEARQAFDLEQEPARLRDAYGRNKFGQGCLLARRLIERRVPFVEVSLNGVAGNAALAWDTHTNNFESVRRLCEVLDAAWATLLVDLHVRGLLDSTLIVWMGEFGRTPQVNRNGGRDHFPQAWSTVLCGGGIRGGQVVGATSRDAITVQDRPIKVSDLIATICRAVGVDPMNQNMSNIGRPIRLADPDAQALTETLL